MNILVRFQKRYPCSHRPLIFLPEPNKWGLYTFLQRMEPIDFLHEKRFPISVDQPIPQPLPQDGLRFSREARKTDPPLLSPFPASRCRSGFSREWRILFRRAQAPEEDQWQRQGGPQAILFNGFSFWKSLFHRARHAVVHVLLRFAGQFPVQILCCPVRRIRNIRAAKAAECCKRQPNVPNHDSHPSNHDGCNAFHMTIRLFRHEVKCVEHIEPHCSCQRQRTSSRFLENMAASVAKDFQRLCVGYRKREQGNGQWQAPTDPENRIARA